MPGVSAKHQVQFEDDTSISLRIAGYSGVADHISVTNGKMYTDDLADNIFDVVVSHRTFVVQKLMLGEVLELPQLKDADGKPYKLRIAGIIESVQSGDPYWLTAPEQWNDTCLMDEALYRKLFMDPGKMNFSFQVQWYSILNESAIRADKADSYLRVLEQYFRDYEKMDINAACAANFRSVLESFAPQARKVNVSIIVMLLPVLVLLISFILMVCKQILDMERDEISVYKSRGADRRQILGIYALQSLCYCAAGLVVGVPLGALLCKLLGASSSFMEFKNTMPLSLRMDAEVLLCGVLAALVCFGAMTLPVLRYSKTDILEQKRKKNHKQGAPLWQKCCLDLVLLGVSGYGLYQFHSQESYLAERIAAGASADPLLYACSSLFMLGASLLLVRLFPLIIGLIFHCGRKLWSPSAYASFLGLIRIRGSRGFLMVFLCLTVSIGIFNAQTARTINSNAQDKIRYQNGADIVFREVWEQGSASEESGEADYLEPDFNRYLNLDGIQSITKVLVEDKAKVTVTKGSISNAKVMGIHTREFGNTANFDTALYPIHPYTYLNAISQNAQAILVSSNFRDKLGYEVGDSLTYSNSAGDSVRGVIYGFVDYWPSFTPVLRITQEDGTTAEKDAYLIVGHLSHMQKAWGITPYQVWINSKASNEYFYDFSQQESIRFDLFRDTSQDLLQQNNEPLFQATNGILTVGFLFILTLCSVGFLVYWILSIQGRTLQFGIFRAMGMSVKEVISILVGEQAAITGLSILSGAGIGMLTAKLFVPLMQLAYSKADQVIPLKIVSSSIDYIRLFAVIGAVMVICLAVLGWLVSRIQIAQALKLGED